MVDFNKVKELVESVKENFVEFVNNKKVDQKVVVEETSGIWSFLAKKLIDLDKKRFFRFHI